MKFRENEVIVREGAEGDTFYIILKGEVREDIFKCDTIFPSCCYSAHILYTVVCHSHPYISSLTSGPSDKESEWAAKNHP